MPLTGFGGANAFNNSKVASRKIISDTPGNAESMVNWGNSSKTDVGLASHTKPATNPTDGGASPMTPSSSGGASGDGPTPGFTGSGSGIAQLNGAQGN